MVPTRVNALANVDATREAMQAGPFGVLARRLALYQDMGGLGEWLGSLDFAARDT